MTVEAKEKIKRTKSFLFIFPMLSDTANNFLDNETKELRRIGKNVDLPLLNCYIGDVDKPQYNNHIFLFYKWIKTKDFGLFEQHLSKHESFVEMYDPTPGHVMFVFEAPDEFKLEYNLFKSEKPRIYRRFSDIYKKHILAFLDPIVDNKSVESILYSHESRFKDLENGLSIPGSVITIPRDIDNYPIPILIEETFDKQQFL